MLKRIMLILSLIVLLGTSIVLANAYDVLKISSAKRVGDYSADVSVDSMDAVTFGHYNQNSLYEKEPIEWIVLDEQDNKYLLLSKYILTCRDYHDVEENVTWEKCALRRWLNTTFLNTAFDINEKNKILTTSIINSKNVDQGTSAGNDTQDKIFLLSVDEIRKYFGNGTKEKNGYVIGKKVATKGTHYAKTVNNGAGKLWVANVNGNSKYSWSTGNSLYWLRTPGSLQTLATVINDYGELATDGYNVAFGSFLNSGGYFESGGIGVRPAIWVAN